MTPEQIKKLVAIIQREYPAMPDGAAYAIANYADGKKNFGGFFTAVIDNDLRLAAQRADLENRNALGIIALALHRDLSSFVSEVFEFSTETQ